jgi:hypothetical protein
MNTATIESIAPEIPPYAMPVSTLARMFGIDASEIESYAQEGMLPRLPFGMHDAFWLLALRRGLNATNQLPNPPKPHVVMGIGWLIGVDMTFDADDLAAGAGIFERNGLTHEEFLASIGAAISFCGM